MLFKNKGKEWFPVEMLTIVYLLIGGALCFYGIFGGSAVRKDLGIEPAIFTGLGTIGMAVIAAFSKMSKRIDALEKLIAEKK